MLRADSGFYLQVCKGCWSYKDKDPALAIGASYPYYGPGLWTPEKLSNGKWAFKGSNGKYLQICIHCVQGDVQNYAFAIGNSSSHMDAQWTVEYKFPTGNMTLYVNSDGKSLFLSVCQNCGPANSPYSAALYLQDYTSPLTKWTAIRIGN